MADCPTLERLSAFLNGTCADEEADAIEAHMEHCDVCCQRCMDTPAEDGLLAEVRRVMDSDSRMALAGDSAPKTPLSDDGDGLAAVAARTIDEYRLLKELGRGGMGVVYLATQESTKRQVALKVLLDGAFASATARRRFEREVELAALLSHQNIVTVLESGIARGQYYFAMQYIDGEPLDKYVSKRALSVRDTLRLFVKTCDAIHYAHRRGVIHRDLKPSNILVDSTGEPHILDFGLAKVHGPEAGGEPADLLLSMPGQVMGTLPYMSPEQTTAEHHDIDVRTDVYSMGVMLYRALTGEYPYRVIGNVRDVLDRIMTTEPSRPSTKRRQVNDEVDTIVMKALAKSRERRYQSADQLARDLERFLAGDPIEARRDSGTYILRKFIRRRRVPIGIAMGVLLLIAASTQSMLKQRSERDRRAAGEVLAALVYDPVAALAQVAAGGQRVQSWVEDSLLEYVVSGSYADRVVGARGAPFLTKDGFWSSVDGGPLWQNGEWLELCDMPPAAAADLLPSLRDYAVSGTERQQYVALCLLGRLADPSDDESGQACIAAVEATTAPGVVAAATWAAKRLGRSVETDARSALLVDPISLMTYVQLPASDSFRRGSDPSDPDRWSDEVRPSEGVAVAPIFMGQTEVTWEAFEQFLAREAPGADADALENERRIARNMTSLVRGLPEADRPAAACGYVTLRAARRFCAYLTQRGATADPPQRYRLPTEDEWEYACRGGQTGRFCFGNDDKYARYFANCNGSPDPHVTARRMPNFYGVFDMHGGHWEWCDTRYPVALLPHDASPDEQYWVYRGGAYYSPAVRCRSSQRNFAVDRRATDYTGFRVVMELVAP